MLSREYILEYACVVWHHTLTAQQSDKIESLQKRALSIINGDQVFGMPYDSLLFLSNIERLYTKEGQMQEIHSLTKFAKKQAA